MWKRLFSRDEQKSATQQTNRNISDKGFRTRRKANGRRLLRIESVERRQLMASDLASIAGFAVIDLAADGFTASDPPVLVDGSNNVVAAGTPGAQRVTVQLFNDDGTVPGTFDVNDTLAGTDIGDSADDIATGRYRFDGLSVGNYFVVQGTANGVDSPGPQFVAVTEDDGEVSQTIDDFTDATGGTFTNDSINPPDVGTQTGLTNAIGGERNVQLDAATGVLTFSIDTTNDNLSIGASSSGTGNALIQYDGTDGSINLDPTGLGVVNLRLGSDSNASNDTVGLILLIRGESPGAVVDVTLHSGAGNSSTFPVAIPVNVSPNFSEIFIPLSDFEAGGSATILGTGVDFENVGAIEAEIQITNADNDVVVSIVESRISDVFVSNLLNIETLSLSGTLFIDVSAGGTNNGVQDATEVNFTSQVTVQLFIDDGSPFDPVGDTPIATTTTNASGDYLFENLNPGDYRVYIPPSQFTDNRGNAGANGVLFGFTSSLESGAAPDPDDDVDLDDNGELLGNGGIVSNPITLTAQNEPTNDEDISADTDASNESTNTTLDFGFLPQVDLQITKSLLASSQITPGGTAVFRLTVQNLGPLDATGVTVVDTLPAGLTFDQLQNNGSFTATQNGQDITIVIGALAAQDINGNGGIVEFDLVADIAANQTTDVTNNSTVSTAEQFDPNLANNADAELVDFRSTDLSILKEVVTDPVVAGENIEYRITVTNDGPDDATGVFVTDLLPDNVTFVSGNVQLPGEDGTVDNSNLVFQDPANPNDPQALRINIGNVANNGVAIITLIATVNSDSIDTVTNPATVSVEPDTDPNPGNDSDTVTVDVDRNVDLAIAKTFTPTGGSTLAGGTGQYTLTITNNGPGVARGISVIDVLPDGVNFVSQIAGSDETTFAQDGGSDNDGDEFDQLTFGLADLAPGAANERTITFNVSIDSDATGNLVNNATVSTTDTDTVAANNAAAVTITPELEFDLTVAKTAQVLEGGIAQASATPGDSLETLVYTITVTNDAASPSTAPNVVVTDPIPAGLTNVVIDAPGSSTSSLTNGIVQVEYASLAPGQSQTFTVTATVPSSAVGNGDGGDADTDNDDLINTATVASSSNAADETNTANNTATAETELTPQFDLQVSKVLDPTEPDANFNVGETVAFNVTVTNAGPTDSTAFTLSDATPVGLTLVSATIGATNATITAGGLATFDNLQLASGASTTAVFTYTVDADANGAITNTASVPNNIVNELDDTNNTDDAVITAVPIADVVVTKTVDVASADEGDTLTFTIVTTNNGPSPAEAVTVTDDLPGNVTFVSATGPGGVAITPNAAGDIVFNGGTLADDASFTITVIATINAAATGTVVNPATVTTTTAESNTANNAASATTIINPPDPMTSSIIGVVFIDNNNNAIQDAGELGIDNVAIALSGVSADGVQISQTTTTDASGTYLFDNLPAGTFTVTQTQPTEFRDGQESIGTGATGTQASDNVFSQLGLGEATAAIGFNFAEILEPLSKRNFLASS